MSLFQGQPARYSLEQCREALRLRRYAAEKGRWVTTEEGQHVFITGDGEVRPSGPKSKSGPESHIVSHKDEHIGGKRKTQVNTDNPTSPADRWKNTPEAERPLLNSPPSTVPDKGVSPASEIANKHGRQLRGDGKAKGFSRNMGHGKRNSITDDIPIVGEIVQRKDGPWIVTSVGEPRYFTRDDLEDFDMFSQEPGWSVDYHMAPVERNDKESEHQSKTESREGSRKVLQDFLKQAEQAWQDSAWKQANRDDLPKDGLRIKAGGRTNSGAHFDDGTLYVKGDKVGYYHGGSYDDYRETVRLTDNAELAEKIRAAVTTFKEHHGGKASFAGSYRGRQDYLEVIDEGQEKADASKAAPPPPAEAKPKVTASAKPTAPKAKAVPAPKPAVASSNRHRSSGSKTAQYKGRQYKILYVGDTKYGRRAHLQFMDGSKDFWVDASTIKYEAGDDDGFPARYSLADCRAIIARYQFTEHQHPRARDGTFMARGQGRDRGKGGPEGKIFDAPPKGGPEAKLFDPPAKKDTVADAPPKTEVKPEDVPGPGEFGHSKRPNAAPAPAESPAQTKPPRPGFAERRAKLQERAAKKEAEFEGMTDEERTAHKAERDAKAMVHNARKAGKPAGVIQQLMSLWLGKQNALKSAKRQAKAAKAGQQSPQAQKAKPQATPEASNGDNPFAGFHEENFADRLMDIREGRHLRHQAKGGPVRYSLEECQRMVELAKR